MTRRNLLSCNVILEIYVKFMRRFCISFHTKWIILASSSVLICLLANASVLVGTVVVAGLSQHVMKRFTIGDGIFQVQGDIKVIVL